MTLPPIYRPLQRVSANHGFDRRPRPQAVLRMQLTTIGNRGGASKRLHGFPAGTPTSYTAPEVACQQENKSPVKQQTAGPRDSCQAALELLMSMEQGRPLKVCLEMNRRGSL